ALVAADAMLPAGTQLNYHGTLQKRDDEGSGNTRKAFDLTLWLVKSDDAGTEVLWQLEERGKGEWPWAEGFGRLRLDSQWRTSAPGPALLYDRGDGRSVVLISLPLMGFEKPLAADQTWEEDKLEYRVEKSTKRGDRSTWQIAVRDSFGPKRMLWLDQ